MWRNPGRLSSLSIEAESAAAGCRRNNQIIRCLRDRYVKLPEYASVKGMARSSGKFFGKEEVKSKVLPGLKVKAAEIFPE